MSKRALWILLGACGAVIVVVMVAAVALNNREASAIKAKSQRVQATVTDKSSRKVGWRSGSGDIIEYCVSLSFQAVDGRPASDGHRASGTTCYHIWEQDYTPLEMGDQVAAYYNPSSVESAHGAEVYLAAALEH